MPTLSDDRDVPDEVLRRAAQADPWVMYLIVRQDVPASAHHVLLAAAQATMRCAAAFASSSAWAEAFEAWAARSFRKVSLRAKGTAWAKLAAYDAGVGVAGGTEIVRALPPRLRSQCAALLRNLQVYNPASADLAAEAPAGPTDGAVMTFAINPRAAMSVGKQVAQVSHAVLMCAWSPLADDPRYRDAFTAWHAQDFPCRIAPPSAWDALRERRDRVVVRDAGLTEVEPGTETVLALPPGAVP